MAQPLWHAVPLVGAVRWGQGQQDDAGRAALGVFWKGSGAGADGADLF